MSRGSSIPSNNVFIGCHWMTTICWRGLACMSGCKWLELHLNEARLFGMRGRKVAGIVCIPEDRYQNRFQEVYCNAAAVWPAWMPFGQCFDRSTDVLHLVVTAWNLRNLPGVWEMAGLWRIRHCWSDMGACGDIMVLDDFWKTTVRRSLYSSTESFLSLRRNPNAIDMAASAAQQRLCGLTTS